MSTTSNLGLNLVTSADFVDPDTAFVKNFEKIDTLGLDYITNKGTTGNWWWRQWKSGRMEMGVDSQTFSTFSLQTWGAMFMSDPLNFGGYPKTFSNEPLPIIMFRKDDNGNLGGIIHVSGSDQTDLKSKCPNFRMVDAANNTYKNPKFGIYVTGTYA